VKVSKSLEPRKDSLWAIDGVKGFQVWFPFERKVILSRDVVFEKLFMLHYKPDEDLGKVKDVTKQVEFESFKIRNVSDQKQFEAPDETGRVLQMHHQHQNSTTTEGTD